MSFVIYFGLVTLIAYLANKYFLTFWERNGVPQGSPSFFVGDIASLMTMRESMAGFFDGVYNNFKQHRVFGVYFSYRPAIVINDVAIAQDVLIKDFNSFHDRIMPVNEEYDPLSGHLFRLSGGKWRDLRTKMSPTFSSGKLKGMFSIIIDCSKVLETYLVKQVSSGTDVIDFRDVTARFSTNIISSVAFGIDNDCINEPDHKFRKMGANVFAPTLKNGIRLSLALYMPKIFELLKLKSVDENVESFMMKVARETVDYREKNNYQRNDFMQLLIELKNQGFVSEKGEQKASNDQRKLTMNELSAQAFVFFIAGFETTSTTTSFTLFELARNSEIQRKCQEEVDRVNKTHGITYESLSEMKYLDSCIDETLRKYPPLPVLFRKTIKDYQVSGSKMVIPEGTPVFIPIFSFQRDPAIYDNPLEYRPERFGEGIAKSKAYMPFGDGPRGCIGMRMGKYIAKIGLAMMLSKLNFELHDKSMQNREIGFHPTVAVLTPIENMKMKVQLRNVNIENKNK